MGGFWRNGSKHAQSRKDVPARWPTTFRGSNSSKTDNLAWICTAERLNCASMKIDVIEEWRHWRRSLRCCQLICDGHYQTYVNLMLKCGQKSQIIVPLHINLNKLRTHFCARIRQWILKFLQLSYWDFYFLQWCMNYTFNLVLSDAAWKRICLLLYKWVLTGSNYHSVAICTKCSACCATDQKLFHIIIHSRPFVFMATVAIWCSLVFYWPTAYLTYACNSKKVMQRDTIKYKALQKSLFLNKQVGGRRHFWFLQSASRLVCPSLGDAGKLQNLRQLQNLDTQAAEIMKSFWRVTNLGELT